MTNKAYMVIFIIILSITELYLLVGIWQKKTGANMENTIENKTEIHGNYGDQSVAMGEIVNILNILSETSNGKALTETERSEYAIIALKLARSVTATGSSAVDVWLDLVNYSRLSGLRRTGVDCIRDLAIVAKPTEPAIISTSEWRLPTKQELLNAHKDKTEGFNNNCYWSKSDKEYSKYNTWVVDIETGYVSEGYRNATYFVRCVKIREDGLLEWEDSVGTRVNYEKAEEWCNKLNKPTVLDLSWRLPTRLELKEAYKDRVVGFKHGSYWSSSSETYTWVVNFKDGSMDYINRNRDRLVRCVRKTSDGSIVWSESSKHGLHFKEALLHCDGLAEPTD